MPYSVPDPIVMLNLAAIIVEDRAKRELRRLEKVHSFELAKEAALPPKLAPAPALAPPVWHAFKSDRPFIDLFPHQLHYCA